MSKFDVRVHFDPNSWQVQVAVGSFIGLSLGIAMNWLSPLMVLGVAAGFALLFVELKRPEVALIGILMITASIFSEDLFPVISVGVSLHIPDILLLVSLMLVLIRWLVEPEFKLVKTPINLPLIVFWGITLLSTLLAISHSYVEIEPARRALRIFTYYFSFFVVTHLVRDRRQIDLLLNAIFTLATAVAVAMVLQYIMGAENPLLPGRVEILETQGDMYEEVIRILPPGYSLLLVSFMTIFCMMVIEPFVPLKILTFAQFCLLGLAILLTFLRSYWAAILFLFAVLIFIFKGNERRRLIGWSAVILLLIGVAFLGIFSEPGSSAAGLVIASVDRLGTLMDPETFQGSDGSLNWRMVENAYAISAIREHPWLGLGMGFTYRPWDPRIDRVITTGTGLDFRTFIHNGHFWILLQSGVLGYFALAWLSLVFLVRGFKYWARVTDRRLRGVVLGFTLTYLAVLISAVVNSSFMQWRWTPVIGMMMGINEVIFMKYLNAPLAFTAADLSEAGGK